MIGVGNLFYHVSFPKVMSSSLWWTMSMDHFHLPLNILCTNLLKIVVKAIPKQWLCLLLPLSTLISKWTWVWNTAKPRTSLQNFQSTIENPHKRDWQYCLSLQRAINKLFYRMISLPPAIKRWAMVTSTCLRTKQSLILTLICLLKLYPSNSKIDPKTITPRVNWIWNLLMPSAVLKSTWMRMLLWTNPTKNSHQLTRMNLLLCPLNPQLT